MHVWVSIASQMLACIILVSGCDYASSDLGHSDRPALYVDVLGAQPTSPEHGVLVRVLSHGGKTIHLEVEDGSVNTADVCAVANADADAGVTTCTCFPSGGALALSVRPTDAEALLSVVLFANDDCEDNVADVLDSKQVPIAKRATNTSVDAAIDADVTDAGIDAAIDAPMGGP